MGSERRSMIITEDEKKVTAVHEAGHALLAALLPHADPVHKVTIIPRGMALGVTMQLPVDDKHNYSRDYLNDQIAILLGGRIAEEITMNGSMTTGAGNDLERSTELARKMVCEWGMSDAHGPADVRQAGRADLPRPRDRAAPGLQRRHRRPHRPGSEAVRDEQLRARARVARTASRARSRSPTSCSRAKCSTPNRSAGSSPVKRSRSTVRPQRPHRRATTAAVSRVNARRSFRRCRRSTNPCRRNRSRRV